MARPLAVNALKLCAGDAVAVRHLIQVMNVMLTEVVAVGRLEVDPVVAHPVGWQPEKDLLLIISVCRRRTFN